MNWRLDLAQKCLDKAERRLEEGRPDMALNLARYARSLIDQVDEDDYQSGRKDGRVLTVRPPRSESLS
jgi:hypothetical protein